NQKYNLALSTALLLTAPLLLAQQDDIVPPALEESPAGESSQVKLPTSPLLVDGRTIILERDGQGNYKLQDMEEAWKYDSLWLGELKANAELFSDMQLELQREPEESMATEVLLPTDTLKA